MRDCETLREDLKAYVDGELPLGARLAMRFHLGRCADCREETTAMENFSRELRASDAGGLSPELRERLVASIPQDLPEGEAAPMWRKPSRPLILWATTATAVMVWFICYPLINRTMPALVANEQATSAAGSAASSKFESNLKQLGTGNMMYAQNYDEAQANASGSFGAGPPGAMPSLKKRELQPERAAMKSPNMPLPAGGKYNPDSPSSELPYANDVQGLTAGAAGEGRAVATLDRTQSQLKAQSQYMTWQGDIERQAHREADITVVVDNPEAKSETVEEMVKIEGGYIASNQLTTGDEGEKYATLAVKIPVAQFDAFLNKVARLGNVKAKNVSGEDLTEKISDTKQAVKVLTNDLRTTQQRLDKSRNRAQNRLDAEDLRQLRIKNAQQKARLEMLTKMATMATVTISLEEKPKKVAPPPAPQTGGFLQDLKDTAQVAGQTFVQAAKLPFVLLVWVVIYAPVWLIMAMAYRRFVRG